MLKIEIKMHGRIKKLSNDLEFEDIEFEEMLTSANLKYELQKLADKYGEGELKEAVRKWVAQVKFEDSVLRKVRE